MMDGRLMPTKIAIVDDSSTIGKLVCVLIESHTDWGVCGEAEDGQTAIALAERLTRPHGAGPFNASEERHPTRDIQTFLNAAGVGPGSMNSRCEN